MEALWGQVAHEFDALETIGGQRYVDRHRARGKMLARERIEQLVDPDTPILELSSLAGWGTDFPIGAGVVNAIGIVEGVEVGITATDMTYRGGSFNPSSLDKSLRFFDIVEANRLPWISLNESAGADLPHQADVFTRGGASFKRQTQLSAAGIPTIT
ncbi:MAG: acyl-CoA carboxylase subunit beta, partial [Ilumatobacteraceae bacterium]|nr:acyl-CoA carboxylase subunit beta [Ilumatobacteraceae bacterium]